MNAKPQACVQIEQDLIAAAASEAEPAVMRRVHDHIGVCAPCGGEYARYRALEHALGSWRQAPLPPAVVEESHRNGSRRHHGGPVRSVHDPQQGSAREAQRDRQATVLRDLEVVPRFVAAPAVDPGLEEVRLRGRQPRPRSAAARVKHWEREARRLLWRRPWRKAVDWKPPHAKWFVGGRLNACENCVDRHVREGRGN